MRELDRPPLTVPQLEAWLNALKNCPLSLRLDSESDFDDLKETIKLPDEIENHFQRKENELKAARLKFERIVFQEQHKTRQLNFINQKINENSTWIKTLSEQNEKLAKEKELIEKKLEEFSSQKEIMTEEIINQSNKGTNKI